MDTALSLHRFQNDRAGFVRHARTHGIKIIELRKPDAAHQWLERLLIMSIAGD